MDGHVQDDVLLTECNQGATPPSRWQQMFAKQHTLPQPPPPQNAPTPSTTPTTLIPPTNSTVHLPPPPPSPSAFQRPFEMTKSLEWNQSTNDVNEWIARVKSHSDKIAEEMFERAGLSPPRTDRELRFLSNTDIVAEKEEAIQKLQEMYTSAIHHETRNGDRIVVGREDVTSREEWKEREEVKEREVHLKEDEQFEDEQFEDEHFEDEHFDEEAAKERADHEGKDTGRPRQSRGAPSQHQAPGAGRRRRLRHARSIRHGGPQGGRRRIFALLVFPHPQPPAQLRRSVLRRQLRCQRSRARQRHQGAGLPSSEHYAVQKYHRRHSEVPEHQADWHTDAGTARRLLHDRR